MNAPCRTAKLGSRWTSATDPHSNDDRRNSANPYTTIPRLRAMRVAPGHTGAGADSFGSGEPVRQRSFFAARRAAWPVASLKR